MDHDNTRAAYCELHRRGASIKFKKIVVTARLVATEKALAMDRSNEDLKQYLQMYQQKLSLLSEKENDICNRILGLDTYLSSKEIDPAEMVLHVRNRKQKFN